MSFTWSGDFNTCNFWRSFAEDRQRGLEQLIAMRRSHEGKGIGVGGQSLTKALSAVYFPVPGVKIMIQINPHHIHIIASGGLYLESGFYDFDWFNATKEVPPETGASVYYTDLVSNLLAKTPDQAQTKVNLSATLEDILDGEDLESGWRSRTFVAGDAPDREAFIRKFKAMTWVKPSAYPGKLSLLVSAFYGSDNYDLLFPNNPDIKRHEVLLDWGGIEILNGNYGGYNGHSGLFTYSNPNGDREYWLMQTVANNYIRFIKLEFDDSVKPLMTALSKGKFDDNAPITRSCKTRAEAYVLAHASLPAATRPEFLTPEMGRIVFEVPIDTPIGRPLYYGWQWNWSGNEADVVVHDWVRGEGPDGCDIWKAKHLKMRVTYAPETTHGSPFSVTTTVESEDDWWPFTTAINYLYPAYYSGWGPKLISGHFDIFYLSNELEPPVVPPDPRMKVSNIPVYCFRDDTDELRVVKITDQLEYRTDQEDRSEPLAYGVGGSYIHTWLLTHKGYGGTVAVDCGVYSITREWIDLARERIGTVECTMDATWAIPWTELTLGQSNVPYLGGGTLAEYVVNQGYGTQVAPGDHLRSAYLDWYVNKLNGECYPAGLTWSTQALTGFEIRTGGYICDYLDNTTGRSEKTDISIIIPFDTCKGIEIVYKDTEQAKNYVFKEWKQKENTPDVNLMPTLNIWPIYNDDEGGVSIGCPRTMLATCPDVGWYKPFGSSTPVSDPSDITNKSDPTSYTGKVVAITSSVMSSKTNTTDFYDYFNFSLLDPYTSTGDYMPMSITGGFRSVNQYEDIEYNYTKNVSVGWA